MALILKGGHVVDPQVGLDEVADIIVEDGLIKHVQKLGIRNQGLGISEKQGTRDQGLGISKNPKEGGATNPSSLLPNPLKGDGPSLEAQLEFDQRALHFQKVVFIEAILCFLTAVILLLNGGNTIQIASFLLTFFVCLVEANWTPTIHTTFRDRIKA